LRSLREKSQEFVIFAFKFLILDVMKNLIIVVFTIFFISCNSDKTFYSNTHYFEASNWKKDEQISFEMLIEDIECDYSIELIIDHLITYQFSTFLLGLNIIAPDGNIRQTDYEINFRNKEREFIGERIENYQKFNYVAIPKISFNQTGIYQLNFKHYMPFEVLHGIYALTLNMQKKD